MSMFYHNKSLHINHIILIISSENHTYIMHVVLICNIVTFYKLISLVLLKYIFLSSQSMIHIKNWLQIICNLLELD